MDVLNHIPKGNDTFTGNGTFPEPIGGVPVFYDLVPTLLFCIGFAVAFGIGLFFLIFSPHRRTLVKAPSFCVSFERIVVTSFRIAGSLRSDVRESAGMTDYAQISLSLGFLTILQGQLYLALAALVLATRDGIKYEDWDSMVQKDPQLKEKRNAEREMYRRWFLRVDWGISIAQILESSAASANWTAGADKWVLPLRLAGNMYSACLIMALLSMIYKFKDVECLNQKAMQRLRFSITLLMLDPLFRATVSLRTISSMASSPASSLPAKIAFYLFQLLPELAVCLITACTDYRALCDTGKWGDAERRRLEKGLPTTSKFVIFLKTHFHPWAWQRLISSCMMRRRDAKIQAQTQVRSNDLFFDLNREKQVSNPSTSGWQSTTVLSGAASIYSSQMDAEKRSIFSEPSSTRSKGRSIFGGSDTEPKRPGPTPLISDVKIWKPRLPPGLSNP